MRILNYTDVAGELYHQIAHEAEGVAKVAHECARNTHPDSPHSPDYFRGYAEAMADLSTKLLLRAELVGPPADNVVPLRKADG